jgi:hypothetical protein
VSEDYLLPLLPDRIDDVKLPVDCSKESHFVRINLAHFEARDFAPSAGRVVTILQILGCQDQGRKEHTTTALQCTQGCNILGLLHREVVFGDMRLDQNQVVQSDLQGAVAGARAAQGLLDKSPERYYATGCSFTPTGRSRGGPNDFHHLSGRIDEAVDKVDLAVTLTNQWRRLPMVDGC